MERAPSVTWFWFRVDPLVSYYSHLSCSLLPSSRISAAPCSSSPCSFSPHDSSHCCASFHLALLEFSTMSSDLVDQTARPLFLSPLPPSVAILVTPFCVALNSNLVLLGSTTHLSICTTQSDAPWSAIHRRVESDVKLTYSNFRIW